MLEVVRGMQRFVAAFAYNLPAQVFIQRSSAAGSVRRHAVDVRNPVIAHPALVCTDAPTSSPPFQCPCVCVCLHRLLLAGML